LGTPVVATSASQRVAFVGRTGGHGNAVIHSRRSGENPSVRALADHGHESGAGAKTRAEIGNPRKYGLFDRSHVHYEVKNTAGRHVDPRPLLFPRRTMHTG
jgi:hypothetical protein